MLNLVESFLSIQGEGKFSGKLAYFFRFAGCNLRCVGFKNRAKSEKSGKTLIGCDTLRAVFINEFKYKKISNCNELLKRIRQFKFQKPIIVITGGEPLIYYANSLFYEFISELLRQNYEVYFETNGTIFVEFDKFPNYKKCIFAISPKLNLSGEKKEKRLNFNALLNLKQNAKDSFYKFVITGKKSENDEICEILQNCENEVYCMPLGKNLSELEKNAPRVAKFCIKNGYNYSDRLHIRISQR
ncbi:MAG: 7-carboxy-7-deazaguanine synthase QueE [Campylobacter sp.]|nr:7-carboxy-7-deazaguanine synthase QueE [Campylobacter sp.]